ncbi:hypothetical protein [Glutamicibacter sp. NPDC087344]|uniref:hypothetical protein n=1 Tax=Glutamicibacter sp. NPDC087344 TaxID=3363994 RepID=UPI0037F641C7
MKVWERKIRLRIEESAEIRRFLEAQARKTEAESSLCGVEARKLIVETAIKEIERRNNALDNFYMEVARQRADQVETNKKHIAAILGGEAS